MDMSTEIGDLAAALAKAQAAIKPAVKDSTNPHFKSRYADLGAVWEACRVALTSNGLSVVQLPNDAGEGRIGLTCLLMHSSGQWMRETFSTRLQQDNAQGVGSALTYLRRYGLAALVGIVADDDDDGNAASAPRQQPQAQQQQRSASYERADTRTPIGQPTNGNGARPAPSGDKASEPQIKALFGIWKAKQFPGTVNDWIHQSFNCHVNELTKAQASTAIESLKNEPDPPANGDDLSAEWDAIDQAAAKRN